MTEIKITVEGYLCRRCGYSWIPKSRLIRPLMCARCKSTGWDYEGQWPRKPNHNEDEKRNTKLLTKRGITNGKKKS